LGAGYTSFSILKKFFPETHPPLYVFYFVFIREKNTRVMPPFGKNTGACAVSTPRILDNSEI
jgi:hypothetical protein